MTCFESDWYSSSFAPVLTTTKGTSRAPSPKYTRFPVGEMWIWPVGGMSFRTKAGWPSGVEVLTWLATAPYPCV